MSEHKKDTTGNANWDDDDYVAQLLAKDARDCSLRYSALGVYGPSKRGAPKPNTRFLKHIIRETDSHNANLKRKEEEEAREKMRNLREGRDRHPRPPRSGERSEREHKRRRVESPDRREKKSEKPRGRDQGRSRQTRKTEDKYTYSDDDYNTQSRRRKRDHQGDRSDTEDVLRESDVGRHNRKEERDRRGRHRRKHECSKYGFEHAEKTDDKGASHHNTHTDMGRSPPPSPPAQTHAEESQSRPLPPGERENDSACSSDPLSDIIGPAPPPTTFTGSNQPVRSRGRGAHKTTNLSNIDAHFSSNYDPALDLHLEDDQDSKYDRPRHIRPVPGLLNPKETDKHVGDDWDMALEALRDRALWKRKGAESLRRAGFEDKVIEKWEASKPFAGLDSSDSRDIETVKWAKKGERREWDRGKAIDEDGHISVKAPW
ncbi:pre-mRNA-splicing factor 38B [Microsporum canis CBS 113480]|uniref:Pre-mRNA-splicing factor 38B n=1 Tax=Arthroderma otae (strain ATCC MYA-4605 / CBS 113480) TaxID=554155 RepID=C5FZB6_ARTOC|nr:pre-mRNA-splicing factor 38B [Microsporum canis CBS 113480]EEQ35219.1 pre-mRNA-splicing factor 38B [Microsporum canis CBS 113480]